MIFGSGSGNKGPALLVKKLADIKLYEFSVKWPRWFQDDTHAANL